ncbi:PEP-CTERM sorting domain-containing protein [Puniceicoccus vermicola]|uniref:PEP-CTERM sorting domain-containing protein n=1 Tax=Puniceicoccus vermicola TaxID=388746 RepID=A0A7X1AX35_9BACT|nr:PEP-CTERM sorting domain-containing protein [Puniceicoccus vermicola]MBC2601615.1 PEP-CTERM sorting domain-containing protein [Puniceicoccus vermicola]
MKTISLTLLATGIAAYSLCAQNILINFGSGTGNSPRVYTGTNSPGHNAGELSGTNWINLFQDTASGIEDEFGNATNLAIDFGTTTTDTGTTLNYSAATKSANYSVESAVDQDLKNLFDTNLGEGNAVRDGSGSPGIGLSISGLDAGEYRFYVTSFRGDTEANARTDFDIYAGSSNDAITDFSDYSVGTIFNSTTVSGWSYGDNYLSGTFTIDGTNDTFSLLSNSNSYIGVLTSLEIVSVPEPGTYAAMIGGIALLLVATRRRRA